MFFSKKLPIIIIFFWKSWYNASIKFINFLSSQIANALNSPDESSESLEILIARKMRLMKEWWEWRDAEIQERVSRF